MKQTGEFDDAKAAQPQRKEHPMTTLDEKMVAAVMALKEDTRTGVSEQEAVLILCKAIELAIYEHYSEMQNITPAMMNESSAIHIRRQALANMFLQLAEPLR